MYEMMVGSYMIHKLWILRGCLLTQDTEEMEAAFDYKKEGCKIR